ncbi:MAG: DUF4199 domain-containing protein [Bacteroidales bacterium]|nr:DUF4199 domain-containing protein [Bacteroidales bacterium]
METTKKSLFSTSLYYGLILGAILVVISILYYILDVNIFNFVFMVVSLLINAAVVVIVLLLGINTYRDKSLGGEISFSTCFLSGLIMGLIGFVISAIYTFVFYKYFEPDLLAESFEKFVEMMENMGLPEEQLDEIIQKSADKFNPESQLRSSLITGGVIAVIISLIVSAFVKKQSNVYKEDFN